MSQSLYFNLKMEPPQQPINAFISLTKVLVVNITQYIF